MQTSHGQTTISSAGSAERSDFETNGHRTDRYRRSRSHTPPPQGPGEGREGPSVRERRWWEGEDESPGRSDLDSDEDETFDPNAATDRSERGDDSEGGSSEDGGHGDGSGGYGSGSSASPDRQEEEGDSPSGNGSEGENSIEAESEGDY